MLRNIRRVKICGCRSERISQSESDRIINIEPVPKDLHGGYFLKKFFFSRFTDHTVWTEEVKQYFHIPIFADKDGYSGSVRDTSQIARATHLYCSTVLNRYRLRGLLIRASFLRLSLRGWLDCLQSAAPASNILFYFIILIWFDLNWFNWFYIFVLSLHCVLPADGCRRAESIARTRNYYRSAHIVQSGKRVLTNGLRSVSLLSHAQPHLPMRIYTSSRTVCPRQIKSYL